MKAIILAAGKGTRCLPVTLTVPKSLIKVGGVPIIERIFSSLPEDIDEVMIVVDHLKDKIEEYIGGNFYGKKVTYTLQGDKKGTFGALLSAKDLLINGERFLVLNGDDLHDKDELVKCTKYPRSMSVQKKIAPRYYSTKIDNDGNFLEFKSQTEEEKINGALIATGTYVLDTNIFKHEGIHLSGDEYGLPQTVSTQKDEYPIKVVETNGWISINTPEELEKAQKHLN